MKKILCLILATLMALCSLPLSVIAAATVETPETKTKPVVTVSSLYSYDEGVPNEFRALPDNEGVFYLDIALDKAPEGGGDVVVYYRTVDNSAVAAWGDYESVGIETYVTLTKSNGYKARVTVQSKVIEQGFVTSALSGGKQSNKIVTRRFLFELTRVEGDAVLHTPSAGQRDQSKLYCYLRANNYSYQTNTAGMNTSAWQTGMKQAYWARMEEILDYYWENDPAFSPEHMAQFRDQVQKDWEKGIANVKFDSCYYSIDSASYINTPHIKYKGEHSDSVNLKFPEDLRNYVASGVCDVGISINGTITRDWWDSDGDATFTLYYTYQGKTKKALTLYLRGEFDDSTFFGWEHAFEYAIEGLTDNNRDDHMDENFIGFTLYDNDEKVVYEIKHDRNEQDEDDLCEHLMQSMDSGYAVELMAENNEKTKYNDNFTAYYLKLPSDFALADSYSYKFISDSTYKKEIRWLENVKLTFALMCNEPPMIAKDEQGNQMVTTNIDTIIAGDPIRMSIRFDRPVFCYNPNNTLYITADVYSDKGACLAQGMKLRLKQVDGAGTRSYYYYAWDTLVFECELPASLGEAKIASIRNIKIADDGGTIQSFFTKLGLEGKTIKNIYVEKDLRTPVATVNPKSTEKWVKSKSLDLSLHTKGNNNARFTDYVTVYYQWSDSPELPKTYSSKVTFYTDEDGEVIKSIAGTGNGEMYLHMKSVSIYGKTSISDAVTSVYDPSDKTATYTPFGPYLFDNSAPTLSVSDIVVGGTLKDRIISLQLPNDDGKSGVQDLYLYRITESGEEKLFEQFTADDFVGDEKTLSHKISHKDVGVGVNDKGELVFAREEVEFYWVVVDKLGNSSGKTAEFSVVFDTYNYLDSEVTAVSPYDASSGDAKFKVNTQKIDDLSYIYNYRPNNEKTFPTHSGIGKKVYYGFSFTMKAGAFGETDNGTYGATVRYKGTELTPGEYTVEKKENGICIVWIHKKIDSGFYEIQLTRTENASTRVSRVYSVYATDGERDETPTKNKIESGTLLTSSVYMLSSEYPYFYYKDTDGAIQKEYYSGTKQPATFSSLEKAKEYVYFKELGDIELIQLNAGVASALISGTTGYVVAKGETTMPKEGQYWIRYKSEAWTPTADGSAWVYYYYGTEGELSESLLSSNLQTALNTVANRIVGYGRSVILTDTSLFLGSAMEDKLLDEYGMPYLAPGQIHSVDEFSTQTMCKDQWSAQVAYAADRNIYKSNIFVGVEGSAEYKEYPLIGRFELPENASFEYMTYEQYTEYEKNGTPTWKPLNLKAGNTFVDIFTSSGVYYIREKSIDGVSVYAIFIDKDAPKVSFTQTDDEGNHKDIPIDGVDILEVRTKDLYIGSIAATEYDRLSYVAIYKVSSLALVDVYTANELDNSRIKLEDGNYYIVVADRSGNHYTVTAKVSSTDLECNVKEYPDKLIKLTCNRKNDEILRYEVYLNGQLVTATYAAEQSFEKAGTYTIYIQDIYGNEFSTDYIFERNYPTVTWKYLGDDGKYHTYDPELPDTNGFVLTWVSDNQYKISTAVKMKFSFNENYGFEFVGSQPEHSVTLGVDTVVTIEAGQSFTLKVYYKNHKNCYSIYTGVVDVTPPSINVSAEMEILQNGEYGLFGEWLKDGIVMDDIYYVLSEVANRYVSNGENVRSDTIRINASDPNDLSLLEVYLNGECIKRQDVSTGFSQVIVGRSGEYRIVAKDTLGNVSEFSFTNGMPDGFDYFVDGVEKEFDPHGYLNFQTVNGKHVYTKVDYGKSEFRLDVKQEAEIFMSVGATGEATEIYGYKISNGQIYSLKYTVGLDEKGENAIQLSDTELLVDMKGIDFKVNKEYLISKDGAYAVYASFDADKVAHIRVYAPDDLSTVVSVSARVEVTGNNTVFVSSEISKKSSDVYFKELGVQTSEDIRANKGFTVDESMFDGERVSSVILYYSKLNDLDIDKLDGRSNIYAADKQFIDEGFYLMIVRNHYGNERVYRIAISRSFGVTSSVTFADGHKIYYSKNHDKKLYSNGSITLDVLDENVTVAATLNGAAYTDFAQKIDNKITYLTFSEEGTYEVVLTDSYGNTITRSFEINKSTYTVADDLLTGYNEKALKRKEGYTNQALTVEQAVLERDGIYYLAIQYGEKLTVLLDSFSETPVSTDGQNLSGIIGADGDGIYTVICRNRYGAVVTVTIHYRSTPTLMLERTIRSQSEPEAYDLKYALSIGFWSNNSLTFRTAASTYEFTVNGIAGECPKTLVFENSGDYGNYEYDITYIDEYGFEYSFKAHLSRRDVTVTVPSSVTGIDIDGILNTTNDVSITFGEGIYATYTLNNGEEISYSSGETLKKDGTYKFFVVDYAGNATTTTIKKDTVAEFTMVESVSGMDILNGGVVNSTKIDFEALNGDSAYIESVLLNGVAQENLAESGFKKDGKWELIVRDKLGNKAYFCFYLVTRKQNGFAYTTPYEYRITEVWYDGGDGTLVSYTGFVNHDEHTSSFNFTENGKYAVVMTSTLTGMTYTFKFTVDTTAPEVSLVGCNNGETTLNDVTITGCVVGDVIKIYMMTERGEVLVDSIEVTSMSTKMPTITEGGEYRIVVESEAGVPTELTFVRKHVMNTSGSIFVMIMIGLAVIGLFTGLIYRNKSKTDE